MKRRDFLKARPARRSRSPAAPRAATPSKARVVVIGGGYGGATAAKYMRMWDPAIDVVLVERDAASSRARSATSCSAATRPCRTSAAATTACARHGVQVVRDEVDARSTRRRRGAARARRRRRLRPPDRLARRRLHRSTSSQGYAAAMQAGSVLHAWKAGPQTVALRQPARGDARRRRLRAVHPARAVPLPAGPYERACMVADYFKRAKPHSKILVLDANPDVTSKAGLFKRGVERPLHGHDRVPRQQRARRSTAARAR